jgi:putative ABC transport system permease protein
MNDLTLIRKGIFRKKLRAFLLTFSIMIAFLIFGALGSFYAFWEGGAANSTANDRLVTLNRVNFTLDMPIAYHSRVQTVEGVRNATHANWFGGYYQDPRNFVQTFAVDPETYLLAYPELTMPDEQREAFLTDRTCLLTGKALAEQFEWSLGDRIPLSSNIWSKSDGSMSWDFTICAIFDAEDIPTPYAVFHYDYYNEALAFNRDRIGWMIINTTDVALNDQVGREIDALFANSPAETETSTEAAFQQAFLEQIGNIALILTGVIGAAFATILMIVGTTMVMAINERRKEIAVLKTLGFQAPRIFRMVLSESIFLSLLGGTIGMGLSSLLITGASSSFPGLEMSIQVVLIGVGLMIGLGLITGLWPAIAAQRLKIVDAFGKL